MVRLNFNKNTLVVAIIIVVIVVAIGFWYYNNNKNESLDRGQERKKVAATCNDPEPDKPKDINISTDGVSDSATITWLGSSDIDQYYVYHYFADPLKAANPVNIIPTVSHFLKVDKLIKGKHWFRVRCKRGCAASDFSDPVEVEIDIECDLELKDDMLDPQFDFENNELSWNKIEGVYSYGILIMQENYNKQLLVSDDSFKDVDRIEISDLVDENRDLNDILICAVNSCGQSNLIYVRLV